MIKTSNLKCKNINIEAETIEQRLIDTSLLCHHKGSNGYKANSSHKGRQHMSGVILSVAKLLAYT
jgi:hypothetical protein